ncbi:hypothetical protein [Arthrobacter sp. HLT1-20]
MTIESWLPFGQQDDPQKLYSALHEGVPEWMSKSIRAWQQEILEIVFDTEDNVIGRFHSIEQELRTAIDIPQNPTAYGLGASVISHFQSSGDELVLTDYLLSIADIENLGGWESLQEEMKKKDHLFGRLDSTLKKSGSKWTIGIRAASRIGLIQRVPEGVQIAANETMRSASHAGRRLAEAWGAVFGINPDPSRAYSLAVKAVEDAAIPAVSPNNTHATLGTIISQMRDTGDWALPLQREDQHATTSATLLSMMKMLWAGQADRHGGHHDPTLVITQEAAEVAVMAAATLVQWFASGAVARRGS